MEGQVVTGAERKANAQLKLIEAAIARSKTPDRYTVEKKLDTYSYEFGLSTTAAVLTVRDSLTNGTVWFQWYTDLKRPNTARFLGGQYYWTLTSKSRRIKKNYRKLWSVLHTFIH